MLKRHNSLFLGIAGFSIMEVVVAAGLMGVTAVGMSSLYKSGFITQKSLLARDDTRSIISDMTSVLSDATACANTFVGLNPSTGASFTLVKDNANVTRYQTGATYGNRTTTLNSLVIGGTGTDTRTGIKKWSASGTGGVALVIATFTQSGNTTNNGNGTGPQQLIRYFLVNVQTLSGSNILTCQAQTGSLTTASEGSGTVGYLPIWQTSTSLGDSSFYKDGTNTILASGNLGIGTTAPPAAPLTVNGEIMIGSTAATCSSINKGSLRYNSTLNVFNYCDGTNWEDFGSSSESIIDWY